MKKQIFCNRFVETNNNNMKKKLVHHHLLYQSKVGVQPDSIGEEELSEFMTKLLEVYLAPGSLFYFLGVVK